MERQIARSVRELPSLVDLIHDEWFDIADIRIDTRAHEVTIPFCSTPRRLVVRRARELQLDDTEGVDRYDLNTVTYEREREQIIIHTGVPLHLVVLVEGLEVVVECSSPAL